MDVLEKVIVGLAIALVIVIAIGMILPMINGSGSEKGVGNQKLNSTIVKELTLEANAINSSSPIPIKEFFIFGAGTTIQNTSQSEFNKMYYNFSVQKSSDLYVYSNGFYVPTYEVIEETYYKGNSASIGDYIPSLIGQKVYLSFIDIINSTFSKNTSAYYIIKNEKIQGDEVIWNLTFDGNINNTITSKVNYSTAKLIVSCLNGIIFLNHTALLSPVPCFTNTTKSQQ